MRKQFRSALAGLLLPALIFQTAIAQNTSPYWSLAGNSNATGSSKLGTTNNIPLRLFTNNGERLRIDGAGLVGIGTTAPRGRLTLKNNGGAPASSWVTTASPMFVSYAETEGGSGDFFFAMASNTATTRSNIVNRRARGTLAAPAAVQNNDFVGSFQASGYDGSAFQNAANVDFRVDGAPASGNVPLRIAFSTGTNLSNRTERMVVKANGNVGIGIAEPNWPFEVVNNTQDIAVVANNAFRGEVDRVGIDVRSVNADGWGYGARVYGGYMGIRAEGVGGEASNSSYGVYGTSTGPAYARFGVYGEAIGTEGIGFKYGVYGKAAGGGYNVAGYFEGDAVVAGTFYNPSDRRLKTAIQPLENNLDNLMKLKPAAYEFKTPQYKSMNLPQGAQVGLIADEVKAVFPQLVRPAVHPAKYDEKTKTVISEEVKYESVNYLGLIPVLIGSVQEQQKTIENLLTKIEALESQVAKLKSGNTPTVTGIGTLGQATPNPALGNTRIAYSLPAGARHGQLLVTDASGKTVKAVSLSNSGYVDLSTASLASGTYSYLLLVDGKITETKKLTVAR